MSRGEIVGTAIAIFFMSFAYRMLMEQILEENVGKAKLRDINYLRRDSTEADIYIS